MKTTTLWREHSSKPFWGFLLITLSGFFHLTGDIANISDNFISLLGSYREALNSILGAIARLAPIFALIGYLIFTLPLRYLAGLFTDNAASALYWVSSIGWFLMAGELTDLFIGSNSAPGATFALIGHIVMLISAIKMRTPQLPVGVRTAGLLLIISSFPYIISSIIIILPMIDFLPTLPLRLIGWTLSFIAWNFFRYAQPTEGGAAKVYTKHQLSDVPGGMLLNVAITLSCLFFVFEQFYIPLVNLQINDGDSSYIVGSPEEQMYITFTYPYFLLTLIPTLFYSIAWLRQLKYTALRIPSLLIGLYGVTILTINAYSYIYELHAEHATAISTEFPFLISMVLFGIGNIYLIYLRKLHARFAQGGILLLLCLINPIAPYLISALTQWNIVGLEGNKFFTTTIWPMLFFFYYIQLYYGSRIVFMTAFRLKKMQQEN